MAINLAYVDTIQRPRHATASLWVDKTLPPEITYWWLVVHN
jgi:hypothetical protein